MRRIDKEREKAFRILELFDLLTEVREMPISAILEQQEQIKEETDYNNWGSKTRVLVDVFYQMALKHAYGKVLSQHKA